MRRRTFLIGGAAAAAGGVAAWQVAPLLGPESPIGDESTARRIGARFAERFPPGDEPLFAGSEPTTVEAFAERLAALRREDFEQDRIVQVDGWWLAESELRLCVWLFRNG